MFLFESKEKAEWEPYRDHALGILERHGAKVLRHERWAERKLAYEIKKVRRGIYFLTYFEADTAAIDAIRHDCGISDRILRVMIVRCDSLPEEKKEEEKSGEAASETPSGEKATPADAGESAASTPAGEESKTGESDSPAEKESASQEEASPSEGETKSIEA
jgi:ribosomal protein S6